MNRCGFLQRVPGTNVVMRLERGHAAVHELGEDIGGRPSVNQGRTCWFPSLQVSEKIENLLVLGIVCRNGGQKGDGLVYLSLAGQRLGAQDCKLSLLRSLIARIAR